MEFNKKKISNPKQVVDDMTGTNSRRSVGMISLSLLLFLLSIVYIVMPIDYDGPIVGVVDDFLLFMSAFCFMYSQLLSPVKLVAKTMLKMISLIFLLLGVVWIMVLSFTPLLVWVA